jgi:hypothetical protein
MMTEDFRVWSDVPLGAALAGWEPPWAIEGVPFTEDSAAGFALCDGVETPAGVAGDGEAVLVADA